jgi:predicted SnoaL-like aldol condensation-catalyzing enzyme
MKHAIALLSVAVLVLAQAPATRQESNKALLLEFFRLGGDRAARTKMLAENYVQHNPRFLKMDQSTGKSGQQAWGAAIAAAEGHARLTDTRFSLRSVPVAMIAEGEYVASFYKTTLPDPDEPAKSYEAFNFELVRFANGKLAEHWDAVQLEQGWRRELEK